VFPAAAVSASDEDSVGRALWRRLCRHLTSTRRRTRDFVYLENDSTRGPGLTARRIYTVERDTWPRYHGTGAKIEGELAKAHVTRLCEHTFCERALLQS
jgi:hypothetical protein